MPESLKYPYRIGKQLIKMLRAPFAETIRCGQDIKKIYFVEKPKLNIWAGYYDHSPFCPYDDGLILVHEAKQSAIRKPNPNNPVSISLYDWKKNKRINSFGQTYSWNWQQGARALWTPDQRIIYNIFDERQRKYRARIVDPKTAEREDLDYPIQEIDSTGRVYSISYEALARIRPDYGYFNHPKLPLVLEDQFLIAHSSNGELDLQISVHQLIQDVSTRRDTNLLSHPKINHVTANKEASKLIFLFRYFDQGNRITDLYVYDFANGCLRCALPDSGASHFNWVSNNSFIVTCQGPSGFGYYMCNVVSGELMPLYMSKDGHPSLYHAETIITDTYPDSLGYRNLVLFDSSQQRDARTVLSSREPLFFTGVARCDLHPAISNESGLVKIDFARRHKRRVGIVDIELE